MLPVRTIAAYHVWQTYDLTTETLKRISASRASLEYTWALMRESEWAIIRSMLITLPWRPADLD
jgi:hypothetical protein